MLNWYSETVEEAEKRNATDIVNGIAPEKAQRRIERYGRNVLREYEMISFSKLFFSQIKDFTFILLLAAAAISGVIAINREQGNWLEPIVILIICLIYAAAGAAREMWTQKERLRLRSMTVPQVTVVRGGVKQQISVEELVKGDVFFFSQGDRIPADGRLITADNLICDESSIECPAHSAKDASAVLDVTTPISERVNMVFNGCTVLSGTGSAIAVAVAMQTEAGIRAAMVANDPRDNDTPLTQSTNELQKPIVVTAVILCTLIFFVGFSWRYSMDIDAIESLLTALAVAVAVIPEVLASLFTYTKVSGARRLAEKNVVIRNLPAMERLADVTVLCADKTGVFTSGNMELAKIWTAEGKLYPSVMSDKLGSDAIKLLEYYAACSAEGTDKEFLSKPEPSDAAALAVLDKYEIRKRHIEIRYPCVRVIPFERSKRTITTLHTTAAGSLIITKGAPEQVLSMCDNVDEDMINAVMTQFGGELLRVIAVAVREMACPPESVTPESYYNRMTFVGLVGIADPLRELTNEAAAVCARAGVRVIMTTGDHPLTAAAAARECGILREGDEILTGEQLARLSDEELESNISKYSGFARSFPEDKLRIVKGWQNYNEVVAVTGLSVEDTAVLEAADVGLSTAKADVAAQMASDAVIYNGGLASAAGAIREGRTVCTNIRNSARYLLQCDICMALLMIPGVFIFKTFPLLSVQLLFSALIAAGICVIGICCEPSYGESMFAPQQKLHSVMFDSTSIINAFVNGVIMAALVALAFFIGRYDKISGEIIAAAGRTLAFGTLVITEIVGAMLTRMPVNGYRPGVRHNMFMLKQCGVIAAGLLVCMLIFRRSMMLVPVSFAKWMIMLGLGLVPVVVTEGFRLLREMNGKNSLSELFNR